MISVADLNHKQILFLLPTPHLQLDAPLFITWTQCVVSVILIAALGFLGDKYPNIDNFAPAEFKLTTALAVECGGGGGLSESMGCGCVGVF